MRAGEDCVLGVFAKAPVAGSVKTRLAEATSAEWAAEVAAAFLEDTLDRVAEVAARRVIAYAPADAGGYFERIARGRFDLQPQAAGDLGARLRAFFDSQSIKGVQRIVVIGTDSPTLPLEQIEAGFAALVACDVVLGPATDGGYYLVGCRGHVPPIFDGLDWGSSRVLSQTIERLGDATRLHLLAPWYDVDTLDDWRMLCGHVAARRRAGIDPGVPRTEAAIERWRQLSLAGNEP